MAELKGEAEGTVGILDLALAAAFTSTSLRDRCSEPDVDDALEVTTLAERMRESESESERGEGDKHGESF